MAVPDPLRRRLPALAVILVLVSACGSAASPVASPGQSSVPSVAPPSAGVSPTTPASPAAAGEVIALGSLASGGRLDGAPFVIDGAGSMRYRFDVQPSDGRLRASLDLSNRDDCVDLVLRDPSGREVAAEGIDGSIVCPHHGGGTPQAFDIELADGARAGTWTADVDVTDARRLAARLRIVHEPAPTTPAASLLPDLVPWLPWEFGFAAPASDNPGTAHDRDNQPGDPTVSCHSEEEPGESHCLRFSAGVYNQGDGPLSIVFRDDIAYQHVYRPDGTPGDQADNEAAGAFEEREAGRGEWHPFHQHRHLGDMVLYELFAVTSPDGGLTELDTGGKHGYCTFSQQIADWGSTAQDGQYASFQVDKDFCDDVMLLERGWGDIYRWQRPGQYLNYLKASEPDGSMRAGRYLVRFTVDPLGLITESNETNNTGYALVEVHDGGPPGKDTVVVCEQGLGTDPWDPAHVVVPDRFAWATQALAPGAAFAGCTP